ADLVQLLDQRHAVHLLAVQADRYAVFEFDFEVFRLVGGLDRIDGPGEGVGRRLVPRVFEDTRLATAAEQVQIEAVRTLLGRLHRDAVLGGVFDFFRAVHLPFADRSDNLQIRCQSLESNVKSDLIVPLAGTAVGDRLRLVLAGRSYHELGD